MRYCSNCNKITAGRPPYCNFCGRSYGVKLCPKAHKNPRAANACSTCGSHELSTPAPQSGMSRIGYLIGGTILLVLCVYAGYFAYEIFSRPRAILDLMQLGLELGLLLLLWMLIFGRRGGKGQR